MTFTIPLSTKGQLVIPKALRDVLNIKKGQQITLSLHGKDTVMLKKATVRPLTDFIGTLKYKKHKNGTHLDSLFEERHEKNK